MHGAQSPSFLEAYGRTILHSRRSPNRFFRGAVRRFVIPPCRNACTCNEIKYGDLPQRGMFFVPKTEPITQSQSTTIVAMELEKVVNGAPEDSSKNLHKMSLLR